MAFYISIYILLCIIALISHHSTIKAQNRLGILSATIIVLFQGLRWRTGTDWQPYLDCFRYSNRYQVEYVEWGYYIFNKAIRFCTESYTIFLLIESMIICYCHAKTAKYFGVNNVSAILLFSFASTIFPIRYTLAVSIYVYSYRYIVERDLYKYLALWIVASFMHQICALALPAYFIVNRHFSGKWLLPLYAVSCGIGLLAEFVFSNMLEGATLVFQYLPEYSQNKMNAYLVENMEEKTMFSRVISYTNSFVFISLFLYIRKKLMYDVHKMDVLLNMYVFGLSINRIVGDAVPYLSRIAACFAAGFSIILLLWLNTNYTNDRKMNRQLSGVILVALFVYSFFAYYRSIDTFENLFIPYYSIFSDGIRSFVY